MGFVMEKLKKKNKKFYYLDWFFDILLAIAFIYLSFQVREMALQCQHEVYPNLTQYLNYTIPNISVNVSGG